MKVEKILYRGKARSTGGRDGRARTENGDIDVKLTTPKELVAREVREQIPNRCSPPVLGLLYWRDEIRGYATKNQVTG